jgi:hypothetical protein
VGLAAHGPLHVVSSVFYLVKKTAEQAPSGVEDAAGNSERIGLEAGHVPVVTLVAVELELKAFVGGQVVVVGHKPDHLSHSNVLQVAFR